MVYKSINIFKLLELIIYCGIKAVKKEVNGKNLTKSLVNCLI